MPAAAEGLCRQLLGHDPRLAEATYLLGVIALDAGHQEQACTLFVQAVRTGAGERRVRQYPRRGPSRPGPAGGAPGLLPPGDRAAPGLRACPQQPGPDLHAAGDLAAAGASFTEAIRLNPRYATAHNNLGAVLQAQGRHEAPRPSFGRR